MPSMARLPKKRGTALVLAFGLSVGVAPESVPEQHGKLNCPAPDWCDLKLPRPIDKPDESISEQTKFAQTPPEQAPPFSASMIQQPEFPLDYTHQYIFTHPGIPLALLASVSADSPLPK